ncbi:TPA: signal peptidase I [Streptococcus suis]|nr:signal peptidase I [Streptococcus suis]MBY5020466.1 signal peptidase I [Streptococcus suis]HEL1584466.1 signal peptidase I [Streptococcus suis]HEL1640268.1 signal peptidase I [Streptococcus suis]HEL9643904.1 signal peptidase I [Streptococcus suis]
MVKRDLIKNIILTISLILGLVALRFYLFEPIQITAAMSNNYLKQNDVILTVKGAEVNYGDFVLYQVDNKEYVGRIIAKSGDTVTYMDDVFYRNNEIVEESYIEVAGHLEYYTEDFSITSLTNGQTDTVTENTYLILNDNRTNQEDSRTFGLIPAEQVIGRLTFRVSPLSEFGFIDTGLAQ